MSLKPICFMVMPYGRRETGLESPAPTEVDFNALWEKALVPLIEELGYEPVRADQDLGSLIIQEMLERLYFSDLVIADVSIPNGNVYYEIGIRHAAKKTGCVLIGAEWSKPLFDIDQMRQIRYPLSSEEIDDKAAQEISAALKDQIIKRTSAEAPMFQVLPGYPQEEQVNQIRASAIKNDLRKLAEFQGKISAVQSLPEDLRTDQVKKLKDEIPTDGTAINKAAAMEVLYLLRDNSHWDDALEFIGRLPTELQQAPLIQEQQALIQSKSGDHLAAIAGLLSLIVLDGDSSERQGLLGGRYKDLQAESDDETQKDQFLNKAIEHYENGMRLDLNNYYPTCNLPRLYRARGLPDDEKKAQDAVILTYLACDRALERNSKDEWLRPTLLGMAFEEEDLNKAKALTAKISQEGVAGWKLQTTVIDLRNSLKNRNPSNERNHLETLCDELEKKCK